LAAQRLWELTTRPLRPPCISTITLERGASGTPVKVARMPPFLESTGDGFDVDDPAQGGDEVGQVVVGGPEVDGAFQGQMVPLHAQSSQRRSSEMS
jgi:hypothetical protein